MDLTDGASLKLAAAGPSALARSPKAHLPVDQFTNVNSLGISSYPPNMLKTKPLKHVSRNHRFSKSVIHDPWTCKLAPSRPEGGPVGPACCACVWRGEAPAALTWDSSPTQTWPCPKLR